MDLRQVLLAFNDSERIVAVLVQEGDRVHRGQVLARLDTSRLEPQVAQADAQVAAQRQVVERLHNGSRPEEIAQAKANVESAKADAANARLEYDRNRRLIASRAVSQQDLDNAQAVWEVAKAKLAVNQKALELAVAGPRQEDVAQAEAQLRANRGATRVPTAAAHRCGTVRTNGRHRPQSPPGAWRNVLAAKAGVFAGDHRSEMGAGLCDRAGPGQAASRHDGDRDGG